MQSSNGNVIHKDDVKFLNFSQNANFPNSMVSGHNSKEGCESLANVDYFFRQWNTFKKIRVGTKKRLVGFPETGLFFASYYILLPNVLYYINF